MMKYTFGFAALIAFGEATTLNAMNNEYEEVPVEVMTPEDQNLCEDNCISFFDVLCYGVVYASHCHANCSSSIQDASLECTAEECEENCEPEGLGLICGEGDREFTGTCHAECNGFISGPIPDCRAKVCEDGCRHGD